MSVKGLVLDERAYLGSVTPPDAFEDESRFGNDGVHANITWVKNPQGIWVRSFAGDGYVSIPDKASLDLIGDLSIIIWVNTAGGFTSPATRALLSKTDFASSVGGYGIFVDADRQVQVQYATGAASDVSVPLATLTANNWQQFAFTLDQSIPLTTGYLDGANAVTDTPTVTPTANAFLLNIGADNNAVHDRLFIGSLALFQIFNYALSAEQIAAIYQSEKHWFGK